MCVKNEYLIIKIISKFVLKNLEIMPYIYFYIKENEYRAKHGYDI